MPLANAAAPGESSRTSSDGGGGKLVIINTMSCIVSSEIITEISAKHVFNIVASELKDPICHSNECQIGSFSSEATICFISRHMRVSGCMFRGDCSGYHSDHGVDSLVRFVVLRQQKDDWDVQENEEFNPGVILEREVCSRVCVSWTGVITTLARDVARFVALKRHGARVGGSIPGVEQFQHCYNRALARSAKEKGDD